MDWRFGIQSQLGWEVKRIQVYHQLLTKGGFEGEIKVGLILAVKKR